MFIMKYKLHALWKFFSKSIEKVNAGLLPRLGPQHQLGEGARAGDATEKGGTQGARAGRGTHPLPPTLHPGFCTKGRRHVHPTSPLHMVGCRAGGRGCVPLPACASCMPLSSVASPACTPSLSWCWGSPEGRPAFTFHVHSPSSSVPPVLPLWPCAPCAPPQVTCPVCPPSGCMPCVSTLWSHASACAPLLPDCVPSCSQGCHRRCILLPLIFYLLHHVTVRYFTRCE